MQSIVDTLFLLALCGLALGGMCHMVGAKKKGGGIMAASITLFVAIPFFVELYNVLYRNRVLIGLTVAAVLCLSLLWKFRKRIRAVYRSWRLAQRSASPPVP